MDEDWGRGLMRMNEVGKEDGCGWTQTEVEAGEEEWCGRGRKTKALSFKLVVINFNGSYLLAPI